MLAAIALTASALGPGITAAGSEEEPIASPTNPSRGNETTPTIEDEHRPIVPVAECDYSIVQSDKKIEVHPLRNRTDVENGTVEDFYDYGGLGDAQSDTGIEQANTSLLLLYQDADLDADVSVVVVHDVPANDGTGGAVDFNITVLHLTTNTPSPGRIHWEVQDDPHTSNAPDFDDQTDRTPTWGWSPPWNDGGAFTVDDPDSGYPPANGEGLTEDYTMVRIDPAWNEWATRPEGQGGNITDWHFLSATPDPHPDHQDPEPGHDESHPDIGADHLDHYSLNMFEPIVIYSDCTNHDYEGAR